MNHDKLFRACNPAKPTRKPLSKSLKWTFAWLFIVAIISVLGYMTDRDIAHHAEIAKQMECAPEIEMTMPIEGVRT
jgi:hypothetical protein